MYINYDFHCVNSKILGVGSYIFKVNVPKEDI